MLTIGAAASQPRLSDHVGPVYSRGPPGHSKCQARLLRNEFGAYYGVIILALEPRFKTGILLGGGLAPDTPPSEVDAFNFAPQVRMPVILLKWTLRFRQSIRNLATAAVSMARYP
jgi:hypothetical protein